MMYQETACHVCGKLESVMKRCTRCRNVLYCSRQCQLTDWETHKNACTRKRKKDKSTHQSAWREHQDDVSILTDECSGHIASTGYHPPVDFKKALRKGHDEETSTTTDHSVSGAGSWVRLHKNAIVTDTPKLDTGQPFDNVTVKGNKDKRTVSLQCLWSGEEVMKVIAEEVKIPLDRLKVIHKGKIMTSDSIRSAIKAKAVFQVIGERAEDEEGLDGRDIDIMMSQMGLERNGAILALRKKGDIIDAILDVGNKDR